MNLDFLHAIVFYNLLFLPIWIVFRCIYYGIGKKAIKEQWIKREFLLLLFVIYLVSVASITIAPMHVVEGVDGYVNLIPIITQIDIINNGLHNHSDMSIIYENLYGNIILFMPIGFFIPLLIPSRFNFLKVFLAGFIGSCFIEWMQWIEMHWHFYRTTDIDDVILNILGACFGFIIYKLLEPLIKKMGF